MEDAAHLHPDFPIVEGHYQMTKEWSVILPSKFNRRMEDGDLVIWKPRFTIRATVWGNDNSEPREVRLASIKSGTSTGAFDSITESSGGLLRYSYRLKEDSGDNRLPAFYCFTVGQSGHVQMAIYVDNADDIEEAQAIWRSVIGTENETINNRSSPRSLQKMNWPDLSSFDATVGRLATAEDIRANLASFLLEVDGVRKGKPIEMQLPCFALYRDEEANESKRAVVFQAEEADGLRYFGGWLIDDETQIVGFEDEFDLLTQEQIQSEQDSDDQPPTDPDSK